MHAAYRGPMHSDRIWRAVAIALCAAVPASFYALGDATDAFPGVLTLTTASDEHEARPPAQAEDWERTQAPMPRPQDAPRPAEGTDADLARRMASHADLPVVNGNLAFAVVEAETGEVIAERDGATARTPASTMKLLTAAAALRVYDEDETLPTRAVIDGSAVTLQGTGNMMLTDEDLAHLADLTKDTLTHGDVTSISLALDTSTLPGGENPAWGDNGRAGGWVAPTASLALNEGRLDGTPYGPKSADPVGDAAARFAELLRERGIEVTGEIARAAAPSGGETVEVSSPTIGEIVRHTLLHSDNTTAELLGHLVALRAGHEADPGHAAAAVNEEIHALGAELGVDTAVLDALVIHDCSGLSRDNRIPPVLFAAVLGNVASGAVPQLEQILYDVPIAGLTGTLDKRFDQPDTQGARGQVRGKTGYLGGTASLAGVTVLPDGRTVAYAILVHSFDGANAREARAAVDEVAAELVRTA